MTVCMFVLILWLLIGVVVIIVAQVIPSPAWPLKKSLRYIEFLFPFMWLGYYIKSNKNTSMSKILNKTIGDNTDWL